MSQSTIIGLYHPQLMNRVAIASVLNSELSNRVKHVDHIYDLFSSIYSLIILVEPEILSMKYNPHIVSTFLDHVSKPVIVVPYYERNSTGSAQKAIFVKPNPTSKELIDCIEEVESNLLNLNRA